MNSVSQSGAKVIDFNQEQRIHCKYVGESMYGAGLALMCLSCVITEHKRLVFHQRYQCISIDLNFR